MRATSFGELVLLLAASLAMARPGAVRAQEIEIPTIDVEIRVDGRLDEPAWDSAAVVPLSSEWYPGDNSPARVPTTCRLLASRHALHIGCRASDPVPSAIRAHYAGRDEIGGDDAISVLIDPTGTERRGFRFSLTPLGVLYDALYDEDRGDDVTWDGFWDGAGRIDREGYVVEFAIPWRAMRADSRPGGGQPLPWRVLLQRSYPRGSAFRMGSVSLDRSEACLLCQAPPATGLSDVSAGRGARLHPTLTASRTDQRPGDGETARSNSELAAGLTGRWTPSSDLRLGLTVNPDFSQVEADAAEFEINRRFALSFPEKRPFFLDDADFFSVSDDLLFTRTVVDPLIVWLFVRSRKTVSPSKMQFGRAASEGSDSFAGEHSSAALA